MTEKKVDIITGRPLSVGITSALTNIINIVSRWQTSEFISSGHVLAAVESALSDSVDDAGVQRTIIDIIREATDNADRKAGADPVSTISLTCGIASHIMKQIAACENTAQSLNQLTELTQLRYKIRELTQRPLMTDIDKIIDESVYNCTHAELIRETLKLSGIDGRIFFELKKVTVPEIELRVGYCFDMVQPFLQTVQCTNSQDWHAYDVRIACIDGFCETVAEMDGLLSAASETREPLIIFARQFSDDVLHTLAVNNQRGTLRVLPVIVPFDADSANVLKDIAIVSNGDVVSSLEGRLISAINFYDLPIVREVKAMKHAVIVVEDKTAKNVNKHVETLRDAMDDNQLAAPFLMRRARALTSRTVFVRMPDSNVKVAAYVDRTLCRIKSSIIHGIVQTQLLHNHIDTLISTPGLRNVLHNWCELMNNAPVPVQALDAALVNAAANAKLIATCGAVLV